MSTNLFSYEYNQRRKTLATILWTLLIASLILGVLNVQYKTWDSAISLFSLSLLCIPLLWLNARGHFFISGLLLSLIVLMVININLFNGDGILDAGILAYPVFILLGTLLLGKRITLPFTLAVMGSLAALVYLEIHGYIHPTIHAARYSDLITIFILLGVASIIVWVVVGNIEGNLERVKQSEMELRENYDLTLQAWAKVLEYRDKETEGHSRRLVELGTRLARALDLHEDEIIQVRRGALLHDLGKLAIPDDILLKPGALDVDERKILELHPVYAKQMLSGISFLQPSMDIVFSHHERWDGRGYPEGLKGEDIPLKARIFSVVDQWDALTSDRPYRKAWPRKDVIAYFKENAGKIYDPQIVNVFLTLVQGDETNEK